MAPGVDNTSRNRFDSNMFHIHQYQYQQQDSARTRQARSQSVSHQPEYNIDTFSASPGIGNGDSYILHKGAAPSNPGMETHNLPNPYQQGIGIDRPHSAGASLYSPVATLDAAALDVLNSSSSALLYEERKYVALETGKNRDNDWDGTSLKPASNSSQTSHATKRDELEGKLEHEVSGKFRFNEGMVLSTQGRDLGSNGIYLDTINQKYPPQLQDSPAMCPASAISITSRYAGSVSRSEDLCGLIAPLPNQR